MWIEEDFRPSRGAGDHGRAFARLSGAAHQTCSRAVADFSYRATPRDLSVDVWEVVLVVTAQSARIRHVNLVRRPAALDNPNTAGLADPQDRH